MKRCFLLLVITILLSGGYSTAWAGAVRDEWVEPQMLSQDVQAHFSDIVADNFGQLHAVWTEKHGDLCAFDTVMYAVYDQGKWSLPLDVLVSPNSPFCATDTSIGYSIKDARIYVTWVNYVLYVSSAPVNDALDARNWTEPVIVDNINDYDPEMTVDYTGRIHLVFFRERPYYELYYTHSDDQGKTWMDPVLLHEAPDNYVSDRVYIDVDARGRVHVAWTEYIWDQVTDRGGAVYYKRSTDGGNTWDDTIIVDQKNDNYQSNYGPGEINVITAGEDFVLLAWAGTPAGQRWSQWSRDGGNSWFPPELVAPLDVYNGYGLRNFNDGMPLALDGSNRVHIFSSGSGHLTHLAWENSIWTGWDIMLNYEPLHSKAAAINGNQLFFISSFTKSGEQVPQSELRVWWTSTQVDAALIPSDTKPNNVPIDVTEEPTKQPSNRITPITSLEQGPESITYQVDFSSDNNNYFPVILSTVLVLLFVMSIIVLRFWIRPR